MMQEASPEKRTSPREGLSQGFSAEEAIKEAARCMHCDCRKPKSCKLRRYSHIYGARQSRFRGERRAFEQYRQEGGIVYEPGKCINCGICISICEKWKEPLGLTFIGRGFSVRVGVPLGEPFSQALTAAARECVEACPTGALAFLRAVPEPDREL